MEIKLEFEINYVFHGPHNEGSQIGHATERGCKRVKRRRRVVKNKILFFFLNKYIRMVMAADTWHSV